jgi:superoxide reductase
MRHRLSRCPICGNLAARIADSGEPLCCCGAIMADLESGDTGASPERHAPRISREGNTVTVSAGHVPHHMSDAHFVEWISIDTTSGQQRKALAPGDAPSVSFELSDGEDVLSAAVYCNLHLLFES